MENIWIFIVIFIVLFSINRNNKIKKALEEAEVPDKDANSEDAKFGNLMSEIDDRVELNKAFGNYESVESMMQSREKSKQQPTDALDVQSKSAKNERNQIAEEFDVRKAVLYAEIMTPKFKEQ
ncbi:MAG: hypothetical protein R3Y51_05960 [Rikenellaceae bacterium]